MTAHLIAAVLGLTWGSFVGVLVDRVPKGEPVVVSRSHCDSCGRPLGGLDLIPILSWLFARRRCRDCGAPVSAKWTAIEFACAVMAAVAWSASGGDPWVGVLWGAFLGVLVGLALIDLECGRIPNVIVYPSAVVVAVCIVASAAMGGPLDPLGAGIGAGAYGGGLLCVALLSRGGMGMGDVKLAALIGLVLGAVSVGSVGVAAAAAILAGGGAAVVALLRGADRRTTLPFGPMLSFGALVGVVAGRPLADAYLRLFR